MREPTLGDVVLRYESATGEEGVDTAAVSVASEEVAETWVEVGVALLSFPVAVGAAFE